MQNNAHKCFFERELERTKMNMGGCFLT